MDIAENSFVMTSKRQVTIVGAGLVGSLLSLLLKKRGFEVRILEKRSDPRKNQFLQGRSINLIVTARGLHALDLAGLEEKAKELSVKVFGREIHDKNLNTIYQAYGREEECNFAISRSKLNEFLITEAEKYGVEILFDQQITSIDFKNKIIHGETSQSYDLLFGTDGVASVVRSELIKSFPETFKETKEWLGVSYKELMIPADADGRAKLRSDALHIWPRGQFMMMALANLDNSLTVTLYLKQTSGQSPAKPEGPSFDQLNTEAEINDFFHSEFPDAANLISALIKDFKSNPAPPLGNLKLNQWVFEDSVAILGDASHGIVPFFGQGMNSGFEDCTELMGLLQSESDWKVILQKFQNRRKPNTDAIAAMAVENWHEMSEKVADPKFLLRKKVEAILEERLPEDFKSRYGMVTYTRIPYSDVQRLGVLQNQFFQKLLQEAQSLEDVDLEKAMSVIKGDYAKEFRNLFQ